MRPMEIDRAGRDHLAERIRHLASGRITNDEYASSCGPVRWSHDPALRQIFRRVWGFYDDLREYRLTGKEKLPGDRRRILAGFIVFLHSDLAYKWPAGPRGVSFWARLLTLGLWNSWFPWDHVGGGDVSAWPFFRASDLATARRHPRLLRGLGPANQPPQRTGDAGG